MTGEFFQVGEGLGQDGVDPGVIYPKVIIDQDIPESSHWQNALSEWRREDVGCSEDMKDIGLVFRSGQALFRNDVVADVQSTFVRRPACCFSGVSRDSPVPGFGCVGTARSIERPRQNPCVGALGARGTRISPMAEDETLQDNRLLLTQRFEGDLGLGAVLRRGRGPFRNNMAADLHRLTLQEDC